jgi:hypothetical protein
VVQGKEHTVDQIKKILVEYLVSLDEERAFHRIHHDYLFKTLESLGFGEYFISCIKTLDTNVHVLFKFTLECDAFWYMFRQ